MDTEFCPNKYFNCLTFIAVFSGSHITVETGFIGPLRHIAVFI